MEKGHSFSIMVSTTLHALLSISIVVERKQRFVALPCHVLCVPSVRRVECRPKKPSHSCFGTGLDSEYTGDWEFNQMSGTGTRRFANGDVYEGKYFEGRRRGQGKLFFANGDLYSGEWKDDTFYGLGRYYMAYDSTAYEGNYSCGKREGKFKLQHANGMLDIVRYENDRCVGAGVRWSKDRSKTWLLATSNKKKKGKNSPSATSGTFRIKKRIPVVEAVSIGYVCEHDSSLPSQQPTAPLDGIVQQADVPTASPVHNVNDVSPGWTRVISATQRTDVVVGTLL
jgi:hypothetical protein